MKILRLLSAENLLSREKVERICHFAVTASCLLSNEHERKHVLSLRLKKFKREFDHSFHTLLMLSKCGA